MKGKIKLKVYEILNSYRENNRLSRVVNISILSLIVLNVTAVILETVKSIHSVYSIQFHYFDMFSVFVFTVEYILRIWSCNVSEEYRGAFTGRLRFAVTPMALIDLVAILPFYIPMIITLDLRFVRALRLLRIFRLLKIGRYSKSLEMLVNVARAKRPELFIAVFVLVILLILSSSFMYYLEHEVQPNNFSSIPAAMWWGVCTLTTVGYGDIFPVTYMGKVLGALIAVIGIGIFALPAGILASGLVDEMHRNEKSEDEIKVCPHCGKEL